MSLDSEPGPAVHQRELRRHGRANFKGGSASLYLVHFEGQSWICKRYDDEERSSLDSSRLEDLIYWRRAMSPKEREYLDAAAAWPRAVIRDDNGVSGVLLPLAPEPFLERTGTDNLKPRHLTRVTRPYQQGGIYYEMPEKLARLGRLGEIMLFLHERDVVIGDLQPNNVLTTASGTTPAVWLIDCDSALLHGMGALPQIDPGHYKLPTPRTFDRISDFYKLSAVTVRCLEEDNTVWDCRDERGLLVMRSADLRLLRRALHQTWEDGDDARWQALLRSWRLSVSRSGELSYRNDQFVKQEWPGASILGVPAPGRADDRPDVDATPSGAGGWVPPEPSRRLTGAGFAGAVLVVVLLVVAAFLLVKSGAL